MIKKKIRWWFEIKKKNHDIIEKKDINFCEICERKRKVCQCVRKCVNYLIFSIITIKLNQIKICFFLACHCEGNGRLNTRKKKRLHNEEQVKCSREYQADSGGRDVGGD